MTLASFAKNAMLKKLHRDVSGSLNILEKKYADLAADNRRLRAQLNNQQ